MVKEEIDKADKQLTSEDLLQYLHSNGITFGIDYEMVEKIMEVKEMVSTSYLVASGERPMNGEAAYLLPINPLINKSGREESETISKLDLKDFLKIPSVSSGEQVARKISATLGCDGTNVLGETIPAKPGKDFVLRQGKNTRLDDEEQSLISLINGQMSIERYTVHVHPTFEVNSDVSMKTGNISFIGNVSINGNVPSGFSVHAGGDIRVSGTVESATLKAGGSIYIGAGIVGQSKSLIEANGNIQTTFINEGTVKAKGKIEATQAILHSHCTSYRVVCVEGKGLIVGGILSAQTSIEANEIGNEMQTKTELYIGPNEESVRLKREKEQDLVRAKDEFMKLGKLLKIYVELEKSGRVLQGKEKITKLRVQNSFQQTKKRIDELVSNVEEENDEWDSSLQFVQATGAIFANVHVQFGKYRRNITKRYQHPYISLIENEIVITGG
ncbi:hypothetical protein JCM9140_191 [Halalkalibacter wakoensis JCM 9140]|uniref:Flagellar Assembly Protein A N-terminal region domain-containing protein n=2 Tax=Halalkalibacter wakoensis TaxID=127891 RepID=W4PXS2_9BACI|nr:hypothetical protein JCM9140_191 [Halalkalibacter wakoensis JCM 9140]